MHFVDTVKQILLKMNNLLFESHEKITFIHIFSPKTDNFTTEMSPLFWL